MIAVLNWLRLDLRRRWTSLLVLTLLIALAGATVLTAFAGARRGASSLDRLLSRTLPTDAVVLPNQPKFDWAPFEKLPYVQAVSTFVVYQLHVQGIDNNGIDFPRRTRRFIAPSRSRSCFPAGCRMCPAPTRRSSRQPLRAEIQFLSGSRCGPGCPIQHRWIPARTTT